jgi:hypothetical protein
MRLAIVAWLMIAACSAQQTPASTNALQSESKIVQMDEARFWSLIDASVQASPPQHIQEDRLAAALDALPADDVAAFDRMFWTQMRRAYTWDLWGAAYIIHGGASDDGFEYFRRWLVSRGKAAFEAALQNADSLAALIPVSQDEPAEFESFPSIAATVWKSKTGIDPYTAKDGGGFFDTTYLAATQPSDPSGEPFEEDQDYLARRWPRLSERFGDAPLE